jgi:hypothetical protein
MTQCWPDFVSFLPTHSHNKNDTPSVKSSIQRITDANSGRLKNGEKRVHTDARTGLMNSIEHILSEIWSENIIFSPN